MPSRANRSAALALVSCLAGFPAGAQPSAAAPVVRIADGALSGISAGKIEVFKAIPYAAAPVGPLRWRPPQPAASWTGVRLATAFGPACLQPTGAANLGGDPGPVSEDCLTLNVWAPKGARRLPVMVWIHGGGHRYGASSAPYYDGTTFGRDGVVFVSFNYRLAGLGFFAHPALTSQAGPRAPLGNYGLMDQMAALAWVRRNIAAFGGDPSNVTIFGESSSAVDVQALMALPAGQAPFRRAIVESSCDWEAPVALGEREKDGLAMAAKAGLGRGASADQLRALPGTDFIDPGFQFDFEPFVDGRLRTQTVPQAFAEGHVRPTPLILGSNSYEGAVAQNLDDLKPLARKLEALYPDHGEGDLALRLLDTDRYFGAPCRWIAAQNARQAPTFLYRFSYLPEAVRGVLPGAPHGSELGYVFDDLVKFPTVALTPLIPPDQRAAFLARARAGPSAGDEAMADRLHDCWVSFARTGSPACPGAPAWPAYSRAEDQLMDLDSVPAVGSHVRQAQYDALDGLVLPTLLRR
jgi:para-nitrobenzyl esterase